MGTGPRQRLVPTWGSFGASLSRAPAPSLPSYRGNQPLLIPSHQSQPQSCLCCEPQQISHLYRTMGFIQTSLLAPALGSFFVAITSAVSKQHFPHPYSSIPSPCPKFSPSYPCIMPMELEALLRGWLEQHSPCLNTSGVAEELPKVPIPSLP